MKPLSELDHGLASAQIISHRSYWIGSAALEKWSSSGSRAWIFLECLFAQIIEVGTHSFQFIGCGWAWGWHCQTLRGGTHFVSLGRQTGNFWKRKGTGKEWHILRIKPEEDPPWHIPKADSPVAGFLHQRMRSFMQGLRWAQWVKHLPWQVWDSDLIPKTYITSSEVVLT